MPLLRWPDLKPAALLALVIAASPPVARAGEPGATAGEALRVMEPVPSLEGAPSGISPPRSRERLALQDLNRRAREEVLALLEGLRGVPDGPARFAIEGRIVELKKRHHLERLELIARFARQRGDLVTAVEAERAASALVQPPRPERSQVRREAPRGVPGEGGVR